MAGDVKVAIKDEAVARQWLSKVTLINEDYHQAMQEAGQTLEDMENFADGTMVDEFVNLGSSILNAAQATFEAINSIADTVNTVLGKVSEFVGGAIGIVSKVKGLFG